MPDAAGALKRGEVAAAPWNGGGTRRPRRRSPAGAAPLTRSLPSAPKLPPWGQWGVVVCLRSVARSAGLIATVGLLAACSQPNSARFSDGSGSRAPRGDQLSYLGDRRGAPYGASAAVTGTIARHEPTDAERTPGDTLPPATTTAAPPAVVVPTETTPAAAPPSSPTSPPAAPARQSRKPRLVDLGKRFPRGAIVVVNQERALYHVGEGPGGKSVRYPVAIGAPEEMWIGVEFVADKRTNPTWHPVAADGRPSGEPVPGGDPTNPLGKHALYLGRTLWRIHGTIAPGLIGAAASNGCIRMLDEHIAELYARVPIGTEVYVVDSLDQPLPTHRGRKIAQMSGG